MHFNSITIIDTIERHLPYKSASGASSRLATVTSSRVRIK
jgi:hypothetical protein